MPRRLDIELMNRFMMHDTAAQYQDAIMRIRDTATSALGGCLASAPFSWRTPFFGPCLLGAAVSGAITYHTLAVTLPYQHKQAAREYYALACKFDADTTPDIASYEDRLRKLDHYYKIFIPKYGDVI